VAELLTCQAAEDAAGYVASEVVAGTLAGKTGSFVIQHGGTIDGTTTTPFGYIVPGSGTGELVGLRGSAEFRHHGNDAVLTLDYEFT
jgi:Protein of unknown function (DUF3224)